MRDQDKEQAKLKCCEDCTGDDTCPFNDCCMCGNRMEDHDMYSGHSPVSMHEYYCSVVEE